MIMIINGMIGRTSHVQRINRITLKLLLKINHNIWHHKSTFLWKSACIESIQHCCFDSRTDAHRLYVATFSLLHITLQRGSTPWFKSSSTQSTQSVILDVDGAAPAVHLFWPLDVRVLQSINVTPDRRHCILITLSQMEWKKKQLKAAESKCKELKWKLNLIQLSFNSEIKSAVQHENCMQKTKQNKTRKSKNLFKLPVLVNLKQGTKDI